MFKELFTIPFTHREIHSYGVMMVLGFLAATQVAKLLARRRGLNPELFVNAALLALVAGVIGARASHVIESLASGSREYANPDVSAWKNFLNIIDIPSGGLTYYGGFLLATPTLIAYGFYKRIPVRTGMDIIAPSLMVALGFGRIGCLLNGCCYGAESNVPWAIRYPFGSEVYVEQFQEGKIRPPAELLAHLPDGRVTLKSPEAARAAGLGGLADQQRSLPVHPAQPYSTFTAWMIAAICFCYSTVLHRPGRVFALMCLLEGPTRFLLELLRVEPKQLGGVLTLSEGIGIAVFLLGVVLWFAFGKRASEAEERLYAGTVPA